MKREKTRKVKGQPTFYLRKAKKDKNEKNRNSIKSHLCTIKVHEMVLVRYVITSTYKNAKTARHE